MRLRIEVEISRPPREVFAYLTDPASLPEWQGTQEVEQLTSGPVGLGTKFRETRMSFGKRIESITEVSTYEPNRAFAVRIVEGPVPVDGAWELERSGGATQVLFTASGPAPNRLLEPLMRSVVRRQFKKHHLKLKEILESGARSRPQSSLSG